MMEAGELLGMSKRQFRRHRARYEEDGLEGCSTGDLGSPHRNGCHGAVMCALLAADAGCFDHRTPFVIFGADERGKVV
jgi:hypothetical protein